MIAKLALRNISRNRWRTALTIAGVAMGVGILIWLSGYLGGFRNEVVRGATAVELGQVQVASKDWIETPSARHAFAGDPEFIEQLERVEGVMAVSPRANLFGLVGNEDRSVVARLVGVDPEREAATTVVSSGITEGRWLSESPPEYPAPREAVIGSKFAQQLKIGVGDEVVAFFESADGSLGNELLEVTGIVSSGSSAVDRQTVYMHLSDLQTGAAMEGQLHQVAIKVTNPNEAGLVAERLRSSLGRDDLSARSWEEIMPEIRSMVRTMEQSDGVMYIFVYLLVAFGLFNAQRMSALERRREFAMMMAIGVTPARLFWTVLAETVLIAIAGAMAGAIVGSAATWFFVVYGLDLAAFNTGGGGNLEMMGISFSQRLHFELTALSVFKPLVVLLPFAVLCGLLPAFSAARVDITAALSGRN